MDQRRLTGLILAVSALALVFWTPALAAEPTGPGRKPVAIVEGYPAFDAPILHFALKRRSVKVHRYERAWLPPEKYRNYAVVAAVGDLARAKVEQNRFAADDLARLREFLLYGGTLLLLRGNANVFSTADGKEFLAEFAGSVAAEKEPSFSVLQAGHPWLKHLDAAAPPPWIGAGSPVPLGISKGENLIGSRSGQSLLCRIPVGKGQIIYIGWEIAASLPAGRKPSTVEAEMAFEEQVHILMNIVGRLYPNGGV